MTIEQAIKKAIEGGYKVLIGNGVSTTTDPKEVILQKYRNQIFLDLLFWQALGKAMKWDSEFLLCGGCGLKLRKDEVTITYEKCKKCDSDTSLEIGWEFKWHLFIDHLIERRSVESYFKELE